MGNDLDLTCAICFGNKVGSCIWSFLIKYFKEHYLLSAWPFLLATDRRLIGSLGHKVLVIFFLSAADVLCFLEIDKSQNAYSVTSPCVPRWFTLTSSDLEGLIPCVTCRQRMYIYLVLSFRNNHTSSLRVGVGGGRGSYNILLHLMEATYLIIFHQNAWYTRVLHRGT